MSCRYRKLVAGWDRPRCCCTDRQSRLFLYSVNVVVLRCFRRRHAITKVAHARLNGGRAKPLGTDQWQISSGTTPEMAEMPDHAGTHARVHPRVPSDVSHALMRWTPQTRYPTVSMTVSAHVHCTVERERSMRKEAYRQDHSVTRQVECPLLPTDVWQRVALLTARSDLPALARVSKLVYEVTTPSLYRTFRLTDNGPLLRGEVSERVKHSLRLTTTLDLRTPMRKDIHGVPALPDLRTVIINLQRLEFLVRRSSQSLVMTEHVTTVMLDTYLIFETTMTPFLIPSRPSVDRITHIFPKVDTLVLRLNPIHLSRSLRSPILQDLDPAIRAVTLVFEPNRNARWWTTSSGEYTQEEKPYIISDTLAKFVSETTAVVTVVGLEGVHPDLRPDRMDPVTESVDILAVFERRLDAVGSADAKQPKGEVSNGLLSGERHIAGPGPAHGYRLLSMRDFVESELHADEMDVLHLDNRTH